MVAAVFLQNQHLQGFIFVIFVNSHKDYLNYRLRTFSKPPLGRIASATNCYINLVTVCYNSNEGWCDSLELIGLKKIRRQKRLSQLQVAMDLCISREAISYYENGQRSPDVDMLLRMSRHFNVSVDYLITGEEFLPK